MTVAVSDIIDQIVSGSRYTSLINQRVMRAHLLEAAIFCRFLHQSDAFLLHALAQRKSLHAARICRHFRMKFPVFHSLKFASLNTIIQTSATAVSIDVFIGKGASSCP